MTADRLTMLEAAWPRVRRVGRRSPGRRRLLIGLGAMVGCVSGLMPALAAKHGGIDDTPILRRFSDPHLELVRLLNEAAEIEHDLMVQYLYAATSVKPIYESLIGFPAPESTHVLGVAIQEMQHLGAVNRLLIALGSRPVLRRQDFPYEIDIYPFPFHLEPLSRRSLAKYTYCEAPAGTFAALSNDGQDLPAALMAEIGMIPPPNHIGSLYTAIIALVKELALAKDRPLARPDDWVVELTRIQEEGELDHFNFFGEVYSGRHPAFQNVENPWSLDPGDARFPAFRLPRDPTAYGGHPTTIGDEKARGLAWLGNLAYWSVLSLLDMCYRGQAPDAKFLAQEIMTGPMWALSTHLGRLGYGMPYDPLSMVICFSTDKEKNAEILSRLLTEATKFEAKVSAELPDAYPAGVFESVFEEFRADEI